MPSGPGGGQTMRLVEVAPNPAQVLAPQPVPQPEAAPAVSVKSLADIAALADANRDLFFKTQFKHCVRLVRIEPGRLEISLTPDAPKTISGDLMARLQKWTGQRWIVSVSRDEGGQTLGEMEASKRENAILDAKSDPAVAAILARFPGAKIIDVRIPDAPETATEDADLLIEPATDDDETDE
jgi:DNA polymerase-3 subunit gamma/tau